MTKAMPRCRRPANVAMPCAHAARREAAGLQERVMWIAAMSPSRSDAASAIGIPGAAACVRRQARLDDQWRPWIAPRRLDIDPDQHRQYLRIVPAVAPRRRRGVVGIRIAAEVLEANFGDVIRED